LRNIQKSEASMAIFIGSSNTVSIVDDGSDIEIVIPSIFISDIDGYNII